MGSGRGGWQLPEVKKQNVYKPKLKSENEKYDKSKQKRIEKAAKILENIKEKFKNAKKMWVGEHDKKEKKKSYEISLK